MALRISTPSRRPSNEGTDSSPKGQSAGGSRRRGWAPCRELVDEQKSEFRHVKMFMSVLTLSTRSHLTRSRPHTEAESPSLERRRRRTDTGLRNTKVVKEVWQNGKKKIKVTFVMEGQRDSSVIKSPCHRR